MLRKLSWPELIVTNRLVLGRMTGAQARGHPGLCTLKGRNLVVASKSEMLFTCELTRTSRGERRGVQDALCVHSLGLV
jgi:hypothetical protein